MQRLLDRQLRAARDPVTREIDTDALIEVVRKTYEEIERDRRLNARASRLMEEELLEANARIERESAIAIDTLTRNIREGIVVTTPHGWIVTMNPAARKMFGYTEDALIQDGIADLLHIPNNDELDHAAVVETQAFTINGGSFPVELSETNYNIDGKRQTLWLVRDISERKAKEEALQAAKNVAEDANRMKSQFLATMSHELRTPLNAVLGFAEVIRNQLFGPDATERYRDYANDIFTSGNHLRVLIDDILDLSKIEAGGYPLKKEDLDLCALAKECALFIQPTVQKKALKFEMDVSALNCVVHADWRSLKQVLLNLLSNAVKFTPQGGDVSMKVQALDGHVRVRVKDSGIGISPEDLTVLFEPFRQANETIARKFGGTGLGLAISKKLVELHGGEIAIESTPDQGTEVTLILPAQNCALRATA